MSDAGTYIGLVCNFIAAMVLMMALFPPFFDTKRSRMTYGLSESFFQRYVMGNICMIGNAVASIASQASGSTNSGLVVLFCVLLIINCVSVYVNSYILKIKKQNMTEAAEKGITEQEYYEKYLKPAAEAEAKVEISK